MKTLQTTIFLLIAGLLRLQAQQSDAVGITTPVSHIVSTTSKTSTDVIPDFRKDNVRMAIPDLIRGVFAGKLNDQSFVLTVDAGWRDDSLSIEYKHYHVAEGGAGSEIIPGTRQDGLLIEKIYFTFLPSDITSFKTETEELLFVYLGTRKNSDAVRRLISGIAGRSSELSSIGSFGFPVQAEKLEELKKQLKELR
ncbi:MAG: hypothetical protein EOO94_04575 [Pedobacter sp.]|nr:MAG: hypothetical protein EOO94_04575 [Pedobacter sp.]